MTRLWVTGAAGLIGNYLARVAPAILRDIEVIALTRTQLDLLNFETVRAEFNRQNPGAIIHCAALSRSPDCESNPGLARKLNVEATRVLAELADRIPFFFFSSDLVFDGRLGNYSESSATNPLSVYGQTKVEAERFVLENPRHTVIRTSLNAGISLTGERGFNEQLRRGWTAGKATKLFADEFRCPIAAEITARATCELLAAKGTGLFHIAGSERLSRFQIGELIARGWPRLGPRIISERLSEYAGAPRPPDTSLDCSKAQALLSFPLPAFSAWLAQQPLEMF